MNDDIISSIDACKFLKISIKTLLKYVNSGEIPATKMGREWKFSKSLLDTWIKEKTKKDTDNRYKAHLRRIPIQNDKNKLDLSLKN